MEARAEIFPKTLTLQMDFDKSLKTPKVSARDSYYKLKLKTHQMGIYCANNETIHCFLYDETIGNTGPNELISLLALDYITIHFCVKELNNRIMNAQPLLQSLFTTSVNSLSLVNMSLW